MKSIGIIAAMNEEMSAIKTIMTDVKEEKIYDLIFFKGIINGRNCILVESGVGKVNSSRTTQILIDKYEIEYVINVGSAAACNEELNIGDIVVGKTLVQHDFDITAFGHEKGYISNVGKSINSNPVLIEKFENVIKDINNENEENKEKINIKIGTIATGDIFCTEEWMKNKIKEKFNSDAIEMEGASIAQVCYLDKIPFIVIRSISDTPNGNNNITFDKYLNLAAQRCMQIIKKFIK